MTDNKQPPEQPDKAPPDLSDAVPSDPFTDPITFPPAAAATPPAENPFTAPVQFRQDPVPKMGSTVMMPTFRVDPKAQEMPTGAVPPPDHQKPFGAEQGMKSPGFDSIRGGDDVVGSMATYQLELVRVLRSMQQILIETISRLETLENAFDRLR